MKIYHSVQKLLWDTHTQTHTYRLTDDMISPLSFLESRLKEKSCILFISSDICSSIVQKFNNIQLSKIHSQISTDESRNLLINWWTYKYQALLSTSQILFLEGDSGDVCWQCNKWQKQFSWQTPTVETLHRIETKILHQLYCNYMNDSHHKRKRWIQLMKELYTNSLNQVFSYFITTVLCFGTKSHEDRVWWY
jgi:hypothetical protein